MTDSSLNYDKLIGSGQIRTFNRILVAGQNVKRGEALGFITANGKVKSFNSASPGDAKIFYGIAIDDVDASLADKPIGVYVAGEFLINGLIFSNSGDTADITLVNAARALGIYLKTASV